MKRKVILCDLGGVLINLNWLKYAVTLFGADLPVDELKVRWMSLKSAFLFETGRLSFNEFYKQFTSEISSDMPFESFQTAFDDMLGELKPDCLEILKKLAAISELVLLSNSNERHIGRLKRTSDVFKPFSRLFFSHEMHLVKPDKQIFLEVCKEIGREPKDIYFFDDTKANIQTAEELGFNAFLADNPRQIYSYVQGLKIFNQEQQQ